jgi:hypothetical protein
MRCALGLLVTVSTLKLFLICPYFGPHNEVMLYICRLDGNDAFALNSGIADDSVFIYRENDAVETTVDSELLVADKAPSSLPI